MHFIYNVLKEFILVRLLKKIINALHRNKKKRGIKSFWEKERRRRK